MWIQPSSCKGERLMRHICVFSATIRKLALGCDGLQKSLLDRNIQVPTKCWELDWSSVNVLQCWHSEFPRGSDEQKARQQMDQKGCSVCFRENWSIHPSPQCHSPKKMFHPWKTLISIQICRRLWGSFGLASYLTLNAIHWIMDLLCSQDRTEKRQPVFGLKKELDSRKLERNYESRERSSALCCMMEIQVRSARGRWGCAAQRVAMRFNMKSE